MDDKEYKRKLTEVADWYIPMNPERPNRKPQRRKKDEQILELVGDDIEEEEQQPTGPNPTVPPVLQRVRIQGCECEDCGKWCDNGRKTEKKIYQTKKPHWREKCVTCNRFRHPATGKFTLTNIEASNLFSALHRETQGVNNSKYAKDREVVLRNKEKTIIDNGVETITFYHEKTQ